MCKDRARDCALPAPNKHSRSLVSTSKVIGVSLFPLRCATAILYHPGRLAAFPQIRIIPILKFITSQVSTWMEHRFCHRKPK
ncbi:hypothetical protein CEP52_002013 [Fusarium oligoseptatum]|uniref:Uncharacterized protein n=1 Tax=Fusarium oligoseptatum TaxID=2604345 RepID=A0A428UFP3_9HYPO|nr:hypothetical protein CEP52_002013 [Fusarium oligoseptatum]